MSLPSVASLFVSRGTLPTFPVPNADASQAIVDDVLTKLGQIISDDPYVGYAYIVLPIVHSGYLRSYDLPAVRELFTSRCKAAGYKESSVTITHDGIKFTVEWDTKVRQTLNSLTRRPPTSDDVTDVFNIILDSYINSPTHGEFDKVGNLYMLDLGDAAKYFDGDSANFAHVGLRRGVHGFLEHNRVYIFP